MLRSNVKPEAMVWLFLMYLQLSKMTILALNA